MIKNILLHAQLTLVVNPWFAISCRPAKTVHTKKMNKINELIEIISIEQLNHSEINKYP